MTSAELSLAIWNTLLISLFALLVALPVGTALALAVFRTNVFGRRFALMLLCSQIAVPLYAVAGNWSAGFGLQGWVRGLGLLRLPWLSPIGMTSEWQNIAAVGFVYAVASIPWTALIVGLGTLNSQRSAEWQAACDGETLHVLRSVVLRDCLPWMALAAAWCIALVMTEMVVSNLYQVTTIAELVYLDATRGWLSPRTYWTGIGASAGLWSLFLLWFIWVNRQGNVRIRGVRWEAVSILPLRDVAWPVAASVWTVVTLLIGFPLFSLGFKAGWQPVVVDGQAVRYGWSFARFCTTVRETATLFLPEYYWSVVLAACSSLTAIVLAALLFAIFRGKLRMLAGLLVVSLLAVPGPLVGLLVAGVLNRSSPAWLGWLYDHTLAGPIVAQQFRLLPLAWLLTGVIVSSLGKTVWEQARLDGLTWWELFGGVFWPATYRRWLAATGFLAILSVGELSCSILVLPPGVTTVSMRLFELLHFGMRHQDSGLCGMLVLLGWVAAWALGKTIAGR